MKKSQIRQSKYYKAFSLVELSIVIFVIAVFMSMVVAGKALKENAKIRGLIAEMKEYEVAYNNFINVYDARPGDMADASDVFGTDCDATASKCNGDGDGDIEYGACNDDDESVRVMQHMVLAGMLNKEVSGNCSDQSKVMYNSEVFDKVFFSMQGRFGDVYPAKQWGKQSNVMFIGYDYVANNHWLAAKAFVTLTAKKIDMKLDDGIAHKGKLFAVGISSSPLTCSADFSSSSGADYLQTSLLLDSKECVLLYFIDEVEID
jgi:hypothetical protein